jgi:hypothetical protein
MVRLPRSPLRPSCAACRAKMVLTAIDPHPDFGSDFEVHVFECRPCRRTQSYTLRRKAATEAFLPANRSASRRQRS